MRILYGVQGTGNGHITRARMMAEALDQYNIDVDYLFSGKDTPYFDMDVFGGYRCYHGLSFVTDNGHISYLKTIRRNRIGRFLSDVSNMDLSAYDLLINDFEPISAWAARRQGLPSIGLSHQNAFRYDVPVQGQNPLASAIMNWFAPTDQHIGFHWHHFNAPILPPMIKTDLKIQHKNLRKILVYLPFLDQQSAYSLFNQFKEYQFVQYHPVNEISVQGNIICRPLSREGFLKDFADCDGVICNAGFGSCSEALHYGKKLMVLPLKGQMEQLSNALALKQLGLATIIDELPSKQRMSKWLTASEPKPMNYPNVADSLAEWIANGASSSELNRLSHSLWLQSRNIQPGAINLDNRRVSFALL